MGMPRLVPGLICAGLLSGTSQCTFAQSGYSHGTSFAKCASVSDPYGESRGANFLPGKYSLVKAHAYLDKGDTTGALSMFERAAYYGNRDAQYEMAMMYLRGATKVPIDIPRGVAWLKMASEYHQSEALAALQKIDSSLSDEQRHIADGILQGLTSDYSVTTTQRRAKLKFIRERGHAAIDSASGGTVCQTDGTVVDASKFYAEIDEEYADYATTMFGKVDVGPIEQVPAQTDKK